MLTDHVITSDYLMLVHNVDGELSVGKMLLWLVRYGQLLFPNLISIRLCDANLDNSFTPIQ